VKKEPRHQKERTHFEGKQREEYHPYDRHDGTGRGHKEYKKARAEDQMVYRKKGDDQVLMEGTDALVEGDQVQT